MTIDERKKVITETAEGNDRDFLISWITSLQSSFENLLQVKEAQDLIVDLKQADCDAANKTASKISSTLCEERETISSLLQDKGRLYKSIEREQTKVSDLETELTESQIRIREERDHYCHVISAKNSTITSYKGTVSLKSGAIITLADKVENLEAALKSARDTLYPCQNENAKLKRIISEAHASFHTD